MEIQYYQYSDINIGDIFILKGKIVTYYFKIIEKSKRIEQFKVETMKVENPHNVDTLGHKSTLYLTWDWFLNNIENIYWLKTEAAKVLYGT